MTLLDLLHYTGITAKRVASTKGGEYASPCPNCGGRDRFRVWPAQKENGRYWCRGCGKSGDPIQFCRDFLNMTYLEACRHLGIEIREWTSIRRRNVRPSTPPGKKDAEKPPYEDPGLKPASDRWFSSAEALLSWSQEIMGTQEGRKAREFLTARGFQEYTIRNARLGWIPEDRWDDRESWGLEPLLNEKGRIKKLWLPQGLVIPCLDGSGKVLRLRIRRFDPDRGPRYYVVPGSNTATMVLNKSKRTFVVVESELDALLLCQDAGDLIGAAALGSAQARPDEDTLQLLTGAWKILIALDTDNAGAKEAWTWWNNHFPHAERWPVAEGKDPGEARQKGLDLRLWILAGVPDLEDKEERAALHEYDGGLNRDEAEGAVFCSEKGEWSQPWEIII